MRPFNALMEKLRLRPQSAGPGRGGSGDEGGSATASDAADYSSPGAAAAGGSPCRHASAQAALERANSGDSSRTRSLKSIPVLGLMEEEGVSAGARVASSGARGLEPQRSAGSSVVPRGASLSYTDMLAFLDSEAIATKTASPLGKAAEGASDSEESDGIGSLPGGDHGSSACSHTASETGSEITRGLRHFKSIKVSHTYHHLRRNSIERKRDYTEKTEEEKATIMEGIRDNILFQNCPEYAPPPDPLNQPLSIGLFLWAHELANGGLGSSSRCRLGSALTERGLHACRCPRLPHRCREMLGEVVLAMKQVRFAKGKTIIRQGDVGGTDFFVLVKGICAVKKVPLPPSFLPSPQPMPSLLPMMAPLPSCSPQAYLTTPLLCDNRCCRTSRSCGSSTRKHHKASRPQCTWQLRVDTYTWQRAGHSGQEVPTSRRT